MYGIDVGMKYDKLYDLTQLATSLTGHVLAPNKAIVGEDLFTIESGIPAAWTRRCQGDLITEVFPLHWDLMGHPGPNIVLGKGSGAPSVEIWLEEMGQEASPAQVEALTVMVKEKSLEKKGLVTKDEFKAMVNEVIA